MKNHMKYCTILFSLILTNLSAQLSPMLSEKMNQGEQWPVLISFKRQANLDEWKEEWTKEMKGNYVYSKLKQTAEFSQKNTIAYLTNRHLNFRSFYIANLISAEIDREALNYLQSLSEIDKISYDAQQSFRYPTVDNSINLKPRGPEITWGIEQMNVPAVWDMGFKGQGVVVAGEDTGVKWDVNGLKDKYRGFENGQTDHNYNWHDAIHTISPLSGSPDNPCGLSIKEPCDDHSHGTHTVGTMVGNTDDQLFGVAPESKWIGCRNMERGNGALSTYIECFEFFLAPHDLDGKNHNPLKAPHVINNSWYCSLEEGCDSSTFPIMERVVENLKKAGIVVVVSAGNDGANCSTLNHIPAIYEESFTVGSVRQDLKISDFSSNGPVVNYKNTRVKPNVVAPGSDVLSVLPDGSFASWNGTSMAGPHVAGLVALMISANPLLAGQVNRIEQIIEETATRLSADFDCWPSTGSSVPNNTYGFGFVNAKAAVEKALLVVDVKNNLNNEISLYPNPAKNFVIVTMDGYPGIQVAIQNVFGEKIMQFQNSGIQHKIHTEGWLPGLYFLTTDNGKAIPFVVSY
ncbi:MAG: S8 family serine peptidase [Saprospiraceae bacterium]|nr:S8 family serine peptidase [Saprospiraceae bacterium]